MAKAKYKSLEISLLTRTQWPPFKDLKPKIGNFALFAFMRRGGGCHLFTKTASLKQNLNDHKIKSDM